MIKYKFNGRGELAYVVYAIYPTIKMVCGILWVFNKCLMNAYL